MRVLVVEDEEVMADAIAAGLRRAGFAVDIANDGGKGLEQALENPYDVVILDRDLPVMHGDDVCRRLAESRNNARILMLTASATLDDRVDGLNIGADDYLPKPFAFAELVARVRALGRRSTSVDPVVMTFADVSVEVAMRKVVRSGTPIVLTGKELAVLVALIQAEGKILSAEELLQRLWDDQADPFTNAVRVTMVGLRKKLGEPQLVETVRGAGYRVRVPMSMNGDS
jgi:DNA-binding response OmpR family regulator